ncbi:uncharacterized protein LOC143558411 [Bidens hawaiensis]|uniref:uncharacterized protein LOC143558411 n=1 Tax=Bidens hawaiensis TaxID=980011 RepID=UPI00404B4FD8
MTPFKAVYGRDGTSIHEYKPGDINNGSIEASLQEHQRIFSQLKEAISQAKDRMTKQANKHRLEKEFQVNDMVYLKLQNYRQKSVESRLSKKLSKRFYGPFKIIEKIGKVAYKLQLPEGSKIHPVFHVSLLKQCHEDNPQKTENLPELEDANQTHYIPEANLNLRESDKGQQLLIKWKGHPMEEATWEYHSEFTSVFPYLQNIGDNVSF